MSTISIRKTVQKDINAIWEIIHAVIQTADTYSFPPDMPKTALLDYWLSTNVWTYTALIADEVVGTYIIKANQLGQGAHVANASFMVHPTKQGLHIGRTMGEHALQTAKQLGFLAMQFNLVVSTNSRAVVLWQKLGFNIVGQLPCVFKHPQLGLVDAFVMHRFL
ncbi:GNAT family N-acetyltransferase [Beggiatoa leptomitoformis]|uniref:GNAT family N-acetyltransferase n=1 Tax=Beggiatoa leptomitoformis TaxID=288004 RepID=A0A2N9YIS2_9GAMM|nr:GNAT family N-acetyltransferase [Beggiatoa leptomitoformis]ALG67390.1 GNAT family N-acetyltransferase [Beggiatoa leptomitoformis]AUI70400.1 GNAT family N-acetyltransferase [Beggiatoa leptomitoformis]